MITVDQLHPTTYRIEGDHVVPVYGPVVTDVHAEWDCAGMPCVIHSPTSHHMRSWALVWRDDRRIFERVCPRHEERHPDPDQFPAWRTAGALHRSIHSCCGCCGEREAHRV